MELPTETGLYILVKGEETKSYSTVFLSFNSKEMFMFIPTEEGKRTGSMYKLNYEEFKDFCTSQDIVEIITPLQVKEE